MLDALNQLEDREYGRLLSWLPHRVPDNICLIVSTLPGDTLDALQPRGWPQLTVEPLTPAERVQMISQYLAHFAQGLSEPRARKIAVVDAASNPLYIKTLLDDLRATGDHLLLDKQIADYLEATDIPALFDKILTRFERDYERDLPGLVREALSLLWAARRGLTEPELLEALKPKDKASLPAAVWSPVRCALEDGLVDRDGVLAFAHEYLRTAVERRYISDQDTQDDYRLRLADLFEQQIICARNCDELPWLLWQTDSRVRLRACLLHINRFLIAFKQNPDEFRMYWVVCKEGCDMGKLYLLAFEKWNNNKEQDACVAVTLSQLADFLLRNELPCDAENLLKRAVQIAKKYGGENHPDVARFSHNLSVALTMTEQYSEAEPLAHRALEITESFYGKDHPFVATALNTLAMIFARISKRHDAEVLLSRALQIHEKTYNNNSPEIAITLNNIGMLLYHNHQFEDAESMIRRALTIGENYYGMNSPVIAIHLNNLALILKDLKRYSEAETIARRALDISESYLGKNHPNVAIFLNTLALILSDMNRYAEAEPLFRIHLEILLKHTQTTERRHPLFQVASLNYGGILHALNISPADINVIMNEICSRYGCDIRGCRLGNIPSARLKIIIENIMQNPSQFYRIFRETQSEDLALAIELLNWYEFQKKMAIQNGLDFKLSWFE